MALLSLMSVSRAPMDDAHDDEESDAMHNPNWNKQTNMSSGRPAADGAIESQVAATPVTEAELEAYRFRGTPIRRTVARVSRQPMPASDHRNGSHVMPDERVQAISQAEAENPGSKGTAAKAPKTAFPS